MGILFQLSFAERKMPIPITVIPIALTLFIACPATAQQIEMSSASFTDGMMVTTDDVTTCPYHLLGVVTENMRVILLNDDPSREKIFARLRRKAHKLSADAVVLVTIGKPRMTFTSPRSIPVTGRAIKFVDNACKPKPK